MKNQFALSVTSAVIVGAMLLGGMPTAQAQRAIRPIYRSEALGLKGNLPRINVWPGSGTNIDFNPTGESVAKVWLDDPSKATIDFDGSMCSQLEDSGNCSGSDGSVSVLHLKRTKQIDFPYLPSTPTTLLTVITDSDRGRKTYQFEIGYGSGKPEYRTVPIYPDPSSPSMSLGLRKNASLQDVVKGLRVAYSRRLIGRGSPLWGRIQTFIGLVNSGQPTSAAARKAGISMALVNRLAQMGVATPVKPQSLPTKGL